MALEADHAGEGCWMHQESLKLAGYIGGPGAGVAADIAASQIDTCALAHTAEDAQIFQFVDTTAPQCANGLMGWVGAHPHAAGFIIAVVIVVIALWVAESQKKTA